MIFLNRCDLRSAEINFATNSLDNFFSFTNYKRQDTKLKSVSLNKFSGRYGVTNRSHLNSDRSVLLQSEQQIGSKSITNISKNLLNNLSYLATRTMVDTRRVIKHNELRHTNVSKGKNPYHLKLFKNNINQVLRTVPLGHSWDRYIRRSPYVMSRPSSIDSLELTTTSRAPIVRYTVAPTIYTSIETSTKQTILSRENMSIKQLRTKIGVKSAIRLGVRFGSKNYVVTREVTKKENTNMLPILSKPCTKHNLIKCPYWKIKMNAMREVTSLVPLQKYSSRWSMSTATVDKITTAMVVTTESTPVETIYMYLLPSETPRKKVVNGKTTINKSERLFPRINIKLASPARDLRTTLHIVETPILKTTEQQGKKPILYQQGKKSILQQRGKKKLQTANILVGSPILKPYFKSRTDKHEIKLQNGEVEVQVDGVQARQLEKDSANFRKGLIDYSSIHDWSEKPFVTGSSQEIEVE